MFCHCPQWHSHQYACNLMRLSFKRSSPVLSHPYKPPRTVGLPPSQQHNRERALAWVTWQPASCPTRKGSPSLVFLAHRQETQSHQRCTGGRWERKLTQPQPQTWPHLSLLGWVAWLETQHCFCSRWDCPMDSACEKKDSSSVLHTWLSPALMGSRKVQNSVLG